MEEESRMNLEKNQKWKLYKFLKNQQKILIDFENSTDKAMSNSECSEKLASLNGIYQDILEGLESFKGQHYKKLKSFYNPNGTLTKEFVLSRLNSLKSLLTPFGDEVGINFLNNKYSSLRGVYYYIIESYTKIFSFSAILLFFTSSLISIFSSDIREKILEKIKPNQSTEIEKKE
ncbi:hypothetical protein EHQ23_16900 [Leptospira bourretii]|uniref:Uncharacterized protein n=1 Tax=Leptospira bourretii TaxID=2484962 RepID=A0A4R9IQ93_9LEPT|nr:hypothetical protein [Leptospira bourretii]TGK79288.1 hypothetical protein EHQ23_16900 [Leptospira bourretii]TGK92470.1 hypothetical protein EHQ26_08690 [Leptospira bourretii]